MTIETEKFKRVARDGRLVGPLRARAPYDKAVVIRRAQLRPHEPAPLREEAGKLGRKGEGTNSRCQRGARRRSIPLSVIRYTPHY
jgi:hypothetical protein